MTCFKLPGSLIKRIQSVLTRFWWDDKETKKVCWVAWDKLTNPKVKGGLGFKDIENYNISLLAKLSWRLLTDPQALVSRLPLSKYCANADFLDCKLPSSSSYGWQGILQGRALILQGLGWLIGDGERVKAWLDPWLSPLAPLRPIGPCRPLDENLLVSDLIDATSRTWNWNLIRQHFPSFEHLIQGIPLSSRRTADKLVWLAEKKGVYTAESGYLLLSQAKEDEISSGSVLDLNWNKIIWKTNTVPKIRSFLWKAALGALPVGEQLLKRHIASDVACKRCGAVESIDHVLLLCPYAQKVWTLAPCDLHPFSSSPSLLLFLQTAESMRNLPPTGLHHSALYAWIFWQLWKARNELVFINESPSGEQVVLRATLDAKAWQDAHMEKKKPRQSLALVAAIPEFSTGVNCYIDAAWEKTTLVGGFGCVFRSNTDEFVCQEFSDSSANVSSALLAEARALVFALQQASSLGFQEIHIFSDSQVLINLLNNDHPHNDLFAVLHDIRLISLDFHNLSFHFISRSLNSQADVVAKRALSLFGTLPFDV